MRPVIISLALLTALPASGQSPRTVEYFITHSHERASFLKSCHGGISTQTHDAECVNANQAGVWINKAATQNRVAKMRLDVGSIDSPLYYTANPWARYMVLNQCASPVPGGVRWTATQCQAAQLSAEGFGQ